MSTSGPGILADSGPVPRGDFPHAGLRLPAGGSPAHVLIAIVCLAASGCRSLSGPLADLGTVDPQPIAQVGYDADDDQGAPPAAAEATLVEKTKKNLDAMVKFVTMKEQENAQRAKALYQEGDRMFRDAQAQPRGESQETFARAANLFRRASEAAPKTALEQDALFMQGESLFFADRLPEATDAYQKLQKEYPRNRHLDRVAARLFSISRYWIDVAKTQEGSWMTLNLTDAKRPRLDVDGHAIRVLDQIRFDDPTGRLADDATMAAAAEYIRQEKFEEADEFLTDLRETFADSEHLFLAHLLGIKCKLESYAGPAYGNLVLDEAEALVKQTRQRFPDKMVEPRYGDIVDRAAAEIARHRADRIAHRAEYWEDRKEFGAARTRYQQLLQEFPNTPHADTARERLAQIEDLPAIPERRLSWLTTIFPESRSKNPLEMTVPKDGQEPAETILR